MTNRFPGRCAKCGGPVPAGAGDASKVDGRWLVAHITCPVLDADDASYEAWLNRPAEPLVPGMYMTPTGDIVKVQNAKTSGKPYAKRLAHTPGIAKPEFVYEAGLVRSITVDMRMTLAQASAFGVATGVCCVCGAFLTDPKSVAAGIGPICAGRV